MSKFWILYLGLMPLNLSGVLIGLATLISGNPLFTIAPILIGVLVGNAIVGVILSVAD